MCCNINIQMTLSTHWLEPSVHIPCCKLCFSVVAQHIHETTAYISCAKPLFRTFVVILVQGVMDLICLQMENCLPFSSNSASHVFGLGRAEILSSRSPWTWTCHSLLDMGKLLLDFLLVGLRIPDLLSTGHHGYSGFCLLQASLVCLAVQFVDAGLQGL